MATSLALALKDGGKVQLLDCDVEEPNAHVFLRPVFTNMETVFIPVPRGIPLIEGIPEWRERFLVTEHTLSGMHDLERIIGVCNHFGVPALVCINKYDLNEENTRQIERRCLGWQVEVASWIPFDNVVTEALVRGLPVVEYSQGRVAEGLRMLWQTLYQLPFQKP